MTQLMTNYSQGDEPQWRSALRSLVELATNYQLLNTAEQREAVDYVHVLLVAAERQKEWEKLGKNVEQYLLSQRNKYERTPIPTKEVLQHIEGLEGEEERLALVQNISKLLDDPLLPLLEALQKVEEDIEFYQADQAAMTQAITDIVNQLK
jgi:hypothetical protein